MQIARLPTVKSVMVMASARNATMATSLKRKAKSAQVIYGRNIFECILDKPMKNRNIAEE